MSNYYWAMYLLPNNEYSEVVLRSRFGSSSSPFQWRRKLEQKRGRAILLNWRPMTHEEYEDWLKAAEGSPHSSQIEM